MTGRTCTACRVGTMNMHEGQVLRSSVGDHIYARAKGTAIEGARSSPNLTLIGALNPARPSPNLNPNRTVKRPLTPCWATSSRAMAVIDVFYDWGYCQRKCQ